jgi:hypothetical protein
MEGVGRQDSDHRAETCGPAFSIRQGQEKRFYFGAKQSNEGERIEESGETNHRGRR